MDIIEEVADLQRSIQKHNAMVALEHERYERYIQELEELGLTPETVDDEIARLEQEKARLELQLSEQIAEIRSLL